MGSSCKKPTVEINQVFNVTNQNQNLIEYPIKPARNINTKFQTEAEAEEEMEYDPRFCQVSKFEFKFSLTNDSDDNNTFRIRKRDKKCSTVYKSEIWDNMIKFQENQSFKIIKENNKELNDSNLIIGAITEVPLFKKLISDKSMWFDFIKEMQFVEVPKDTMFIKQNTIGSLFYVLKQGKVKVIVNNQVFGEMQAPKAFGERALFNDFIRAASIVTLTTCYLYVLPRDSFLKIYQIINKTQGLDQKKNFLENHYTLRYLNYEQKDTLSRLMIKHSYDQESIIYQEGEIADCFYILKEGEALCKYEDQVIRQIKHGEIFGFTNLLIGNKRTFSVFASKKSVLYSVNLSTLKLIFGNEYKIPFQYFLIKSAFIRDNTNTFSKLVSLISDKVLENFEVVYYPKDAKVIDSFSNINEEVRIILEGDLYDEVLKKRVRYLLNDIICAEDIYYNYEKKQENCLKAFPDCFIAKIQRQKLINIFGGSFNLLVEFIYKTELCKNNPIFKNIPLKYIDLVTKNFRLEKFNNDIIVHSTETGNKFYLIKTGNVEIINTNRDYKILSRSGYFGEKALFCKQKRHFFANAKGYVECFSLTREEFNEVFYESPELKEFIKYRVLSLDEGAKLDDFLLIKRIENKSKFGKIIIVKNKLNNSYYTFKCFYKRNFEEETKFKILVENKSMLMKMDSPFLVKFIKLLKDKNFVFLITDYVYGKDLYTVLKDIGLCNVELARFYGACIMSAINYLHELKIVYRDLKPENIMVTKNGYLKLIDLRNAKFMIKDKTETIIGTPHYMAPEIIVGCGYQNEVDYWSIGICLYEFVCGYLPFGNNENDPIAIFSSILNDSVKFPKEVVDNNMMDLISKLLERNFSKRLTNVNLYRDHKLYSNFNWTDFDNMSFVSPYKPVIDNLDNSKGISFSEYYSTLESESIKERDMRITRSKTTDEASKKFISNFDDL